MRIKIPLEYLESTGALAKERTAKKTMNVSATYAAIIPAIRPRKKNLVMLMPPMSGRWHMRIIFLAHLQQLCA
jgi:hypothetical protein